MVEGGRDRSHDAFMMEVYIMGELDHHIIANASPESPARSTQDEPMWFVRVRHVAAVRLAFLLLSAYRSLVRGSCLALLVTWAVHNYEDMFSTSGAHGKEVQLQSAFGPHCLCQGVGGKEHVSCDRVEHEPID